MSETEPDRPVRSNLRVFLGFLLGIPISIGCSVLSILVGLQTHDRDWLYPLLIAVSLIGAGILPIRRARESSLAVGVVICLSLVLLLDGACAIAYWH